MSVSYASEYPDISVDPAVKAFFEKFYAISDTPDIHERYAQSFTPDATLIMASTKVSGYATIRKAGWEGVARKVHKVDKIFPFGPDSLEFLLYGSVEYFYNDGKFALSEWAGRVCLVKVEEDLKIEYYQVYMDTAA